MRSVLLVLLGFFLGANAVYFLMTREERPVAERAVAREPVGSSVEPDAALPPRVEAPASAGAQASQPVRDPALPAPVAATASAPDGLLLPVSGIAASALTDTFDDARGGARRHEALDIMAPAGTPVLAAADGHIEKLFDSKQGGLTVYQFEPSGRYAYYYAHLRSYAPGLAEKRAVKRGDVIGYVGSTGNADPSAPHLHFAVFALGPEKQWWKGTAINPYPLLAPR